MSRILAVSPHPDDESIGCGGTLRKHIVAGDRVEIVMLTSGEKGGGNGAEPAVIGPRREGEARDAARILGADGIEFWRQPDGAVRASRLLIERMRAKLRSLRPKIVYAPHRLESHADHRAALRLVLQARRQLRRPPRVLTYEVWTPLPSMTEIVDISEVLDVKLAAIRAHRSQCRLVGFDAAMRGLARYRGELHSWPGGDYAEVFLEEPSQVNSP